MGTIKFLIDHNTAAPMASHRTLPYDKVGCCYEILAKGPYEVNGVDPVY